ncbi:hypothetical protein KAMAJI_01610 [Serratia phage vB_SmaM-Kamaji]|nr:hypothetical protein KAMAJI_01610 [Serratia phage vB_SmaM-Kamaji]
MSNAPLQEVPRQHPVVPVVREFLNDVYTHEEHRVRAFDVMGMIEASVIMEFAAKLQERMAAQALEQSDEVEAE